MPGVGPPKKVTALHIDSM
jgi:putative addiction module killer protein/probable addiction module antidote protein